MASKNMQDFIPAPPPPDPKLTEQEANEKKSVKEKLVRVKK